MPDGGGCQGFCGTAPLDRARFFGKCHSKILFKMEKSAPFFTNYYLHTRGKVVELTVAK
jgi:hypothetical protein